MHRDTDIAVIGVGTAGPADRRETRLSDVPSRWATSLGRSTSGFPARARFSGRRGEDRGAVRPRHPSTTHPEAVRLLRRDRRKPFDAAARRPNAHDFILRKTGFVTGTPRFFEPLRAGGLVIPNRILMAPVTRNRSEGDSTPEPYYAPRAGAGHIIGEPTQISAMGKGW